MVYELVMYGVFWLVLPLLQIAGVWIASAGADELRRVERWLPVRGQWVRHWGYLLIALLPAGWAIWAMLVAPGEPQGNELEVAPLSVVLGLIAFLDVGWLLLWTAIIRAGRWVYRRIRWPRVLKRIRPDYPLRSRPRS